VNAGCIRLSAPIRVKVIRPRCAPGAPPLTLIFDGKLIGTGQVGRGSPVERRPLVRYLRVVYPEFMNPVVRRGQVALSVILILYLSAFLPFIGHHDFWRSHGGLLDLVVGGLIVVGVLQGAVSLWHGRERSKASRPENR
jgi:hypothetical protein